MLLRPQCYHLNDYLMRILGYHADPHAHSLDHAHAHANGGCASGADGGAGTEAAGQQEQEQEEVQAQAQAQARLEGPGQVADQAAHLRGAGQRPELGHDRWFCGRRIGREP